VYGGELDFGGLRAMIRACAVVWRRKMYRTPLIFPLIFTAWASKCLGEKLPILSSVKHRFSQSANRHMNITCACCFSAEDKC